MSIRVCMLMLTCLFLIQINNKDIKIFYLLKQGEPDLMFLHAVIISLNFGESKTNYSAFLKNIP